VLQKATTRVILTAPPSGKPAVDLMRPSPDAGPEPPLGHPAVGSDGSPPSR